MRLSTKVYLAFAAVIAVALVTAGLLIGRFVGDAYRGYVRGFQQQQLLRLADEAGRIYADTGDWQPAQRAVSQLAAANMMPGMGAGRGRGMHGQTMGMGADTSMMTPVLLAPGGTEVLGDPALSPAADELASGARVPVTVNGRHAADLWTGAGMTGMGAAEEALLDQVYRAIWWSGVVAALVALAAGSLLLVTILRPLRRLQHGVQQVAGGDLSVRIPVEGNDELSQLALGFNRMATNLEQQESLRRTMVADIAHELRTPISVIQGNLQAILDGVYPLDLSEVATIHEETQLLSRLVRDLHELAQAEAGRLPLALQPIPVGDALEAVAAAFRPLAAQKNVTLSIVPPAADVAVKADPDRLRQIFNNLMGNALRHTPEDGTVELGAEDAGNDARLWVRNTGAGIDPTDLPHVFDRFYRADPSRKRDAYTSGAGLGLTIVKALVDAQSGEVGVDSVPGVATTFWFRLPRDLPS